MMAEGRLAGAGKSATARTTRPYAVQEWPRTVHPCVLDGPARAGAGVTWCRDGEGMCPPVVMRPPVVMHSERPH